MIDDELWTLCVIVGMTVITVVTRSFFFMSSKPWPLPAWAEGGLKFAPIAALAAVIAPEVVMTQGHLMDTWRDARLISLVVVTACYVWRRSLLATIFVGMAVYLPLHIGLGW